MCTVVLIWIHFIYNLRALAFFIAHKVMWSRAATLYLARTVPRIAPIPTKRFHGALSTANKCQAIKPNHQRHLNLFFRCSCTCVDRSSGHVPGHYQIMFTCNVCETRSSKRISKQAYYNGVVVIRCSGCDNLHLIADNLGWLGQEKKFVFIILYIWVIVLLCYYHRNIEDILAEKGEAVTKLKYKDIVELVADDFIELADSTSEINNYKNK